MKAVSGDRDFDSRYELLYGGRWPALKAALEAGNDALEWTAGLVRPYRLDSASVLAALSLPGGAEGEDIECIDLCAAPGGKSLALSWSLGPQARLTCNERSRERSGRLGRVLDDHLPPEALSRTRRTTDDAASLCRRRRDAYDRILLDAPCSSERHVLASPAHLDRWSPARVRSLAQAQWSLLSSAFLMLRRGGYLAYSTCSIGPEENDGVMERLFKKYGAEAVQIDPVPAIHRSLSALEGGPVAARLAETLDQAERTARGIMFLPDACRGAGPMFVALVRRAPGERDDAAV